MSAWPTERAEAHISHLAAERDITIVWTEKPPKAYTPHQLAWCNRPTTGRRYFLALHELGHCASSIAREWERSINDLTPEGRYADLMCEAAAWAWAAEMADPDLIEQITRRERTQVATAGWGSYLFRNAELASR